MKIKNNVSGIIAIWLITSSLVIISYFCTFFIYERYPKKIFTEESKTNKYLKMVDVYMKSMKYRMTERNGSELFLYADPSIATDVEKIRLSEQKNYKYHCYEVTTLEHQDEKTKEKKFIYRIQSINQPDRCSIKE